MPSVQLAVWQTIRIRLSQQRDPPRTGAYMIMRPRQQTCKRFCEPMRATARVGWYCAGDALSDVESAAVVHCRLAGMIAIYWRIAGGVPEAPTVMHPLLIVPPAPARWSAVSALGVHSDPLWQQDFEKRFSEGVPGSQDAFAVLYDSSLCLAIGCISKRHDLGILTRVYVRPEQRGRGLARQLLQALFSWFDMTGGKWLYATTTADLAEGLFRKLGFKTLRRAARTPFDAVVLVREAADVLTSDPLALADGELTIREVSRVNWPTIVVLLLHRPGPDPRISLDESAVGAEQTALELVAQQEAGKCVLKAAFCGPRLVGLASLAVDQTGDRTYAAVMPHARAPLFTGEPPWREPLRSAVLEEARKRGYGSVDFPMEALAQAASGES